jgi:hypothetical protein
VAIRRSALSAAEELGSDDVVFEPHNLMARLCAMVPPPWFHMVQFHGVKLRETQDAKSATTPQILLLFLLPPVSITPVAER